MEGSLLRHCSFCFYFCPFPRLDFIAEEVIKPLLACVNTAKDEDSVFQGDSAVSIPWFGANAFQPSDLEPKFGWKTILIDVIHSVVAVPTTNDEHGILTNNCSVAKSIKRLRSFSINLLPLIFLTFECALPEVVISNAPIIPCEHIDRSIVQHDSVVSPLSRTVFDRLNA